MPFIDKHKAILITVLFAGSVVMAMFNIHITQNAEFIAETLYEIDPKTEEEIKKELQSIEDNTDAKTNKAFNEDKAFKKLMKNFKMVPANDFEKTTKAVSERSSSVEDEGVSKTAYANSKSYAIKNSETEKFNRLKDLIDKKSNQKDNIDEHAKTKSTLTYSLKNRTLLSYDTPRYLCERHGKIIVNIRVNQNGDVYEAYINGASNSDNQCLIDHALEYAKSVRFNTSNRTDQLGTVTFYFKGK